MKCVVMIGQSGMARTNPVTGPALDTTALFCGRALMFSACGLQGLGSTNISTRDLSSVVEAKETGTQTYVTSMHAQIERYDVFDREPTVYINVGWPGAPWDDVKEGSIQFENAIAAVEQLIATYGAVEVPYIVMDWGEAERTVSKATFKGYLQTLQDRYTARICAITGQTGPIPLFMVQIPIIKYTPNDGHGVQDAMMECHIEYLAGGAPIILAAARHHRTYGDDLHVDGPGGRLLGGDIGQAVANHFRGQHDHLRITAATINSNGVIWCDTNATSNLAIVYGAELPAAFYFGITVRNASGQPRLLNEWPSVNGTKIRLAPSNTPLPGWTVEVARSDWNNANPVRTGPGMWANFRESVGNPYGMQLNQQTFRWLVADKITVA